MVCRHNSNLRPTVAHFLLPNSSPISDGIATNMSILFLLSNLSLPPPSLQTSSNLFRGRNSRLVRVPWDLAITLTCSTFFSPFSPLWMLSLLLTFPPLLKHSQLYSSRSPRRAHRFVSLANWASWNSSPILPTYLYLLSAISCSYYSRCPSSRRPSHWRGCSTYLAAVLPPTSIGLSPHPTPCWNLRCQSCPWLTHYSSLSSSCMLPRFSSSSFTRGRRSSPISLLDHSPHLP